MKIENNTIKIDLDWFIGQLTEEGKQRILELYTFDEIIGQIERQLKKDSDLFSWDTSGWRDGSKLREAIIKIQGLEPEFKKDLESTIRSLEYNVAHYKKYYDWYFKIYHYGREFERGVGMDQGRLIEYVESKVGKPE
jgi:hypothetical protein